MNFFKETLDGWNFLWKTHSKAWNLRYVLSLPQIHSLLILDSFIPLFTIYNVEKFSGVCNIMSFFEELSWHSNRIIQWKEKLFKWQSNESVKIWLGSFFRCSGVLLTKKTRRLMDNGVESFLKVQEKRLFHIPYIFSI